jgi:hypothetical protein
MDQEGDTSLQPEPSGEGTSEPTTAMDVSEDEADKALLKLNEDELRNLQKANSIQCIEGMRLWPKEASRFDIPLCQMIYMPLVHPTLAHDIKRLEAEFTHGYQPGASVFYVSTTNENGAERLVKDVDTSNWGPHWTSVNDEFEAKLALNPHLKHGCHNGHFWMKMSVRTSLDVVRTSSGRPPASAVTRGRVSTRVAQPRARAGLWPCGRAAMEGGNLGFPL